MARKKIRYKNKRTTLIQGNALEVLKTLPSESVNCIVTSPPYWSQRDYSTSSQIWDGDPKCKHKWVKHKPNLRTTNEKK